MSIFCAPLRVPVLSKAPGAPWPCFCQLLNSLLLVDLGSRFHSFRRAPGCKWMSGHLGTWVTSSPAPSFPAGGQRDIVTHTHSPPSDVKTLWRELAAMGLIPKEDTTQSNVQLVFGMHKSMWFVAVSFIIMLCLS